MNEPIPAITVIVPTHNRPESLSRCLDGLARQISEAPIEIVVVDDGSADAERVAEIVGRTPSARLVRQPRRGPAAARNAGIQAARGSVLCFTDDDCEPRADWAARLTAAVRAGADVAAGTTMNGRGASAIATASELQAHYFTQRSTVPFVASNNVAATAALLRELPFDSRYSFAFASEDRDWCERVVRCGYRITRDESAIVEHHPQLTLRTYLNQQARYGRGSYVYHRGGGGRRPLERPLFYVRLLGHGFRAGVRTGFLVVLGQLAIGAGFAQAWIGARGRRRARLR